MIKQRNGWDFEEGREKKEKRKPCQNNVYSLTFPLTRTFIFHYHQQDISSYIHTHDGDMADPRQTNIQHMYVRKFTKKITNKDGRLFIYVYESNPQHLHIKYFQFSKANNREKKNRKKIIQNVQKERTISKKKVYREGGCMCC